MKRHCIVCVICVLFVLIVIRDSYSADVSLYYRHYFERYTNERLLIDRSCECTLKQEYGLRSLMNLGYGFWLTVNGAVQGSVIGLTDPPEQWMVDVSLGRQIGGWTVSFGHGRQHNISRGDEGSIKGFGIARTWVEFEYAFP